VVALFKSETKQTIRFVLGVENMSGSVKIGGASGFWGEAPYATAQLLAGDVDVIVYDYLAEITMSILARAKARNPEMGYASDFLTAAMGPNLSEISGNGVKIISNAGGLNPEACGARLREMIADAGLSLKVAIVTGDDVLGNVQKYASSGVKEMFSNAPFPDEETIASANAYLGAFPIAEALDGGADIVITGRCVDSAVTLGACIHAFGWTSFEHDKLSGGALAGHILECGPQATGGNFTDWEDVGEGIEVIGYPIAEVSSDGSFVVTKPENTGGLVNIGTVGEQMLYEIGDPQAYFLPDVVCDFSTVQLTQEAPNRVLVTNATGRPPPVGYKVSMTYQDGYRGIQLFGYYGDDAPRKARLFAQAALKRANASLSRAGLDEFTDTNIEILGTECQFGELARREDTREVTLKIAVSHSEKAGPSAMFKEAVGLALACPPGLCGFGGGLGRPSPIVRLFSFVVQKDDIDVTINFGDGARTVSIAAGMPFDSASLPRPADPEITEPGQIVFALKQLAWIRSGDKGDKANVGVMARKAEYLPYIWEALDADTLKVRFGHLVAGHIEKFLLPGSASINVLMHEALGGGGIASLRNDPQAKGFSQLLLDCPVRIPERMTKELK